MRIRKGDRKVIQRKAKTLRSQLAKGISLRYAID